MKIAFITAIAGLTLAACAPVEGAGPSNPPVQDQAHIICKPTDYQNHVGRHRSEIPTAPAGRIFRVLCSTCAATMDFRDNRVSFTYDDQTQIVTRVTCG